MGIMMKIKALKSFVGVVTMTAGEIKDVQTVYANDLIHAGYAVEVKKAAENSTAKPQTKSKK